MNETIMVDRDREIDNATPAQDDELALYKQALAQIETVCREVADGDFAARLVDIESFGALRGAMNTVNDMLESTEAARRRAAAETDAQRQRMEAEAKAGRIEMVDAFEAQVSPVVDAVSSAARELETTAGNMSVDAASTYEQSRAVASASEQATANVNAVAGAAEELSASITEISRQVSDSAKSTRAAVDETARANEAVRGLSETAQGIDAVVELIRDIAGQTNLLALNATIEAARAGDAGKGFAVVAAEVKTLANETATATKDITAQVAAIQHASADSVKAIGDIAGGIKTVDEIAASIAAAVEEQSAATSDISDNVQQAAASTQDVSANLSLISESSEKTGVGAADMLDAAGRLGDHARQLRETVDAFLDSVRGEGLSPRQIELVQSSFAKVAPIAEDAAKLFYDRLFEIAPEVRPLFKGDMKEQGAKLMAMLARAVSALDKLDDLVPVVQELGRRHHGYGVTAEHYGPVGEALLWTLEQGLGDAFTPAVKAAWTKVYGLLAEVMQNA